MKEANCSCGADFRTENERELVEIVKLHARRSHNRSVTDDDARGIIADEWKTALEGEEITAARVRR